MRPTLAEQRLIREMRTLIAQLEMVSHAPTQQFDTTPRATNEPKGGKCPTGGDDPRDRQGKLSPEELNDIKQCNTYHAKTVTHYRMKLARSYTEPALTLLVEDIEATLTAWRRTPLVAGERPALRDPRWKYWVANCDHTTADLVRWYGITRQYLHQIRRQYRADAA